MRHIGIDLNRIDNPAAFLALLRPDPNDDSVTRKIIARLRRRLRGLTADRRAADRASSIWPSSSDGWYVKMKKISS